MRRRFATAGMLWGCGGGTQHRVSVKLSWRLEWDAGGLTDG